MTASFLYFERDPHGPDIHSQGGLEDSLSTGGGVAALLVKVFLGHNTRNGLQNILLPLSREP
jgi:hypothetical protein